MSDFIKRKNTPTKQQKNPFEKTKKGAKGAPKPSDFKRAKKTARKK